MARNIEMNYKEADNYEVLYPNTSTGQVLTTPTVESIFNLPEDSNLDNVLSVINTNFQPLMSNLAVVTVKLWNGDPVVGIELEGGIKDNNGNTPITDSSGRCVVSTNTDNFTFSITSQWEDINSLTSTSFPKTGSPTYINVTLEDKGIRRLEVTSSKNIKFSSAVKIFDVFGVAGGGGGGSVGIGISYNTGFNYELAGFGYGGGGGYTKTIKNVTNTLESVSITIGNGGTGGYVHFSDDRDWRDRIIVNSGNPGGASSVNIGSNSIFSVQGGEGGKGGRETCSSSSGIIPGENSTPIDLGPSKGGSGGGALTYRYSNTYPTNIPGGQNGSNGGGIGQGTTTKAFEEEEETMYSSGGGTAVGVALYNLGKQNKGGQGAGDGIVYTNSVGPSTSNVNINGNSATSHGSGGGGIVCTSVNPTTAGFTTIEGGNGMKGIVIFRWS